MSQAPSHQGLQARRLLSEQGELQSLRLGTRASPLQPCANTETLDLGRWARREVCTGVYKAMHSGTQRCVTEPGLNPFGPSACAPYTSLSPGHHPALHHFPISPPHWEHRESKLGASAVCARHVCGACLQLSGPASAGLPVVLSSGGVPWQLPRAIPAPSGFQQLRFPHRACIVSTPAASSLWNRTESEPHLQSWGWGGRAVQLRAQMRPLLVHPATRAMHWGRGSQGRRHVTGQAGSMQGVPSREELVEGLVPSGFCHSIPMLFKKDRTKKYYVSNKCIKYIG